MEDEAETWHTCIGHCPLKKFFFFYSGRIRTLVSMAAYIFHSLIMGKVEIGKISTVSLGIIEFYFYSNVY